MVAHLSWRWGDRVRISLNFNCLDSSVVEHWIEAPGVVGAIPIRGTQYETVTNS